MNLIEKFASDVQNAVHRKLAAAAPKPATKSGTPKAKSAPSTPVMAPPTNQIIPQMDAQNMMGGNVSSLKDTTQTLKPPTIPQAGLMQPGAVTPMQAPTFSGQPWSIV